MDGPRFSSRLCLRIQATALAQLRELLAKLAGDPANGIDRVVEADGLGKRDGFPPASFFVNLNKPCWRTRSAPDGPVDCRAAMSAERMVLGRTCR